MRRGLLVLLLIVYSVCASGCVALLAGAAGGAGTATWLSGKLVQEVDASLDDAVSASEKALASLNYTVTEKVVKLNVAQIMAKHTDDRTIWVDVHKIFPQESRVEVRVGMTGDKEAARTIINRIEQNL